MGSSSESFNLAHWLFAQTAWRQPAAGVWESRQRVAAGCLHGGGMIGFENVKSVEGRFFSH